MSHANASSGTAVISNCERPAPMIARPAAAEAEQFIRELRRHKKARMNLAATVEGDNGQPAVEFSGSFVAVA